MSIFDRLFGKTSPQQRKPAEEDEIFARVRANAARAEMINTTRLSGEEEFLAERIKKLLLSASWHNGRDQRAYEHLCGEMKQFGDKIRAQGDTARWSRVTRRVETLCGEHHVGLSQYMYLLGDAPPDSGK